MQYLITITDYEMIPVQVATPNRSSNHKQRRFDFQEEWEADNDNSNKENRCVESHLNSYAAKVQKKMIAALLEKYDYFGAWELAKTIRPSLSNKAFDLITAAKDRYMLDGEKAKAVFKRCGIKGTDIKKPAFEYLLRLELLVRKGEYSDFIRGLTPLLGQLYMLVLDTQCGINVKKYVSRGKWDYNKVKANARLFDALNSESGDFTKLYYNNSNVLVTLIKSLVENRDIVSMCEKLRLVEERVRTDTAHEMVYVSSETIAEKTTDKDIAPDGLPPKNIISIILKVFSSCGICTEKELLSEYDRMNGIIRGAVNT